VIIVLMVATLIRVGMRVVDIPMTRDASVQLLASCVWMALTGGFTMFITDGHRDWSGLVLMGLTLPAALPISRLASSLSARPGRGILSGVALLQGLLVAACVTPKLHSWHFHPAFQMVAICAIVIVMAGVVCCLRYLRFAPVAIFVLLLAVRVL